MFYSPTKYSSKHTYLFFFFKDTPKIFLKDTLFAARTKENITVTIPFLTNPNFTSVKLLVDELSFNSSNHDLTVEDYYMEIDFRGRKVNQMGYKLDFAIVDLQQNDFTTYMITFENEIGAANVSFSITSESKCFVLAKLWIDLNIFFVLSLTW